MVCSYPRSKGRNCFCSTTQIPSARSPAWHFVWGLLIFVGHECGTCSMSLLTPRILRAVLIFGQFVHRCILVFLSIQLHMILSYFSSWNAFIFWGNLISLLALKLNPPVFLGPDILVAFVSDVLGSVTSATSHILTAVSSEIILQCLF